MDPTNGLACGGAIAFAIAADEFCATEVRFGLIICCSIFTPHFTPCPTIATGTNSRIKRLSIVSDKGLAAK